MMVQSGEGRRGGGGGGECSHDVELVAAGAEAETRITSSVMTTSTTLPICNQFVSHLLPLNDYTIDYIHSQMTIQYF